MKKANVRRSFVSDDRYLDLQYDEFHFQVKLDYEGVILDVFDSDGENVATTSKFYEDFGISIKENK